MSLKQESWLVNKRGHRLYTVSYTAALAAKSKPHARLFWHHGLGEHIGRYDKLFLRMADAGIYVYSFDAHGHGKSDPVAKAERALVMDYHHLVSDFYLNADSVLQQPSTAPAPASSPFPLPVEDFFLHADSVLQQPSTAEPLPAFVGGQSMGGLVACLVALERQHMWKGLLLHSAAVDAEWTTMLRIQASIGNVLASLVPRARIVAAVRPEDMSQDPAVVQHYLEDPLNTVGNVCARTGNELLKGFRLLGEEGGKLSLPLYAAHGSLDRCTSRSAAKALLKMASSTDKTWNEVEGGYHELLKGPEAVACTETMTQWILEHCNNSEFNTQSKL
eukprot:gene10662-12344_t